MRYMIVGLIIAIVGMGIIEYSSMLSAIMLILGLSIILKGKNKVR
jgi:hypothetical protein